MPAPCYSCREPVSGPVCPGCGAVQPPPREADVFAILGLARRYHVDEAAVDEAWRRISRAVHPDRHVRAGAVQRLMSLEWTATLNESRRVLKDPFLRASWLSTGRAAPAESGGAALDEAFLETIFSWRMTLEEKPADPSTVRGLREAWTQELARMDHIFTEWEEGRGDLVLVPACLAKLRALDRLVSLVADVQLDEGGAIDARA
jgi:molecular chaperone HscB